MNRSEQPGDGAAVGQGPTLGRCHPVRVVGTHRVSVRLRWVHQVIEPDSALHIVKRHDRVREGTTPGAANCHGRNARSREIPNQGPSDAVTICTTHHFPVSAPQGTRPGDETGSPRCLIHREWAPPLRRFQRCPWWQSKVQRSARLTRSDTRRLSRGRSQRHRLPASRRCAPTTPPGVT